MNFYCDSQGVVFHVDAERIFQGSLGANKIRLIGQFPSTAQVLVAYELPDGTKTSPKIMTPVAALEQVQAPNGGLYSIWESLIGATPKIDDNGNVVTDDNGDVVYDLIPAITALYGTVRVQFFVYGASNGKLTGQVLAVASSSFTVEKGVPAEIPEFDLDDGTTLLQNILAIVANYETIVENSVFDGFVKKTGDTMTGPLIVENSRSLGRSGVLYDGFHVQSGEEAETHYGQGFISRKANTNELPNGELSEIVNALPQESGTLVTEEKARSIANEEIAKDTIKNIQDGTNNGAIQQVADSIADGFDFTGKNDNATALEPALTGIIPYGARGAFASSFGGKSSAQGKRSHAEGTTTIAKGNYSHAEGSNSVALGVSTHAEGIATTSVGQASHSEGHHTVAQGDASHAEGSETKATNFSAHSEGYQTKANAAYSHSEGYNTEVKAVNNSGDAVAAGHAEGRDTKVSGYAGHAEGWNTTASGHSSHAEGNNTTAQGDTSHAEGTSTKAIGHYSHSEGYITKASGQGAHAEGSVSKAIGKASHAEGESCIANGDASHAGGSGAQANGTYSFAHGNKVIAGQHNQSVFGRFNDNNPANIFEIGNGENDDHRSNAFEVRYNGEAYAGGKKLLREGEASGGGGTKLYLHELYSVFARKLFIINTKSTPFTDFYEIYNSVPNIGGNDIPNGFVAMYSNETAGGYVSLDDYRNPNYVLHNGVQILELYEFRDTVTPL